MAVTHPWTWGLGRRKTAVARVRLKSGSGGFFVNGRPLEGYFTTLATRKQAASALEETQTAGQYDVFCNVSGGGPAGQATAVSMGIARALRQINPPTFETLRAKGLLTRDSRRKERKMYGRKGARRGFQFSKR